MTSRPNSPMNVRAASVCVRRWRADLVHRPRWLFVDEPTASLDGATGRQCMQVLAGQTAHGALIVITHDLEILGHADKVFRMRDGHLIETFHPEHDA